MLLKGEIYSNLFKKNFIFYNKVILKLNLKIITPLLKYIYSKFNKNHKSYLSF